MASEKRKQYIVQWYKKNRDKIITINKNRRLNRRINILNYYGGKCACCGESHIEFLAIDHIGGNGGKHRKEIGISGGDNFYQWIIRHNYPKGYRVLCHNCNVSLGLYRYCPHQNK